MLSVYNYKDPVNFLSDFIELKRGEEQDFTLKKWCSSMGLSSVGPLLDVLKRRKALKGKLAERVVEEFSIDSSEIMYFQAIVERSKAQTEEKKLMYDLLIQELSPENGKKFTCLRTSELDLFSHWIYMAILSIGQLPGIEVTGKNIKTILREKIDSELVDKALFELFSHGLLSVNKEGKVINQYSSVSSATDTTGEQIEKFYSMVCDLAKKSISLSPDEREFQCFNIPLSKKKLPLAKEIIRKCRKNLTALSEEDDVDEVYQTNIMLFPLTETSRLNEDQVS